MKVKQASVLFSLKKFARWIQNLPESKRGHEATENRVEDVVCGCFDLLQYSPTTDVAGWIASKPRRKKLDNPAKAVWTQQGRRAILELIELTISEVEACQGFWPDPIEVGVLPIKKPIHRSAEHVEAMQKGRANQRKQQQELRVKALRRKLGEMAPDMSS